MLLAITAVGLHVQ